MNVLNEFCEWSTIHTSSISKSVIKTRLFVTFIWASPIKSQNESYFKLMGY